MSKTHSNTTRPFDLVLYGASGFVGAQTVAYIAQNAPKSLRWAIAGRDEAKLLAVRARELAHLPEAALPQMLLADAQDPPALAKMAAQTRVMLTTAGPYAKYGSALLAACVGAQAHYVDITGETPWVRQMIDAHHSAAEQSGTKIVPFCGFDSIPSDLGVHLLQREMQARHGQLCERVDSAFSMSVAGFNGGTVASLLNILETNQGGALRDLFLLNPPGTRPSNEALHADVTSPSWNADLNAWLGPFIMGPINSRVVRRACALRGQSLVYQEHMRFGRGPLAAVAAAGVSMGTAATDAALRVSPLRRFMARAVPKPGEGPSVAAMDGGHFICELVGTGSAGHKLKATIADRGDAANRVTTKLVCESALALALDFEKLPKTSGVLPPSVAFGDVIEQRLRAAGMRVEVGVV